MRTITCIAIDDEPIALLVIEEFCRRKGGMELVTFNEPSVGLAEITRRKPDLVFLDIEMNGISGIDIARTLPESCCLIFTTAHAQYALDGFNLDATDFLCKPFSYERFERAVDKALRWLDPSRSETLPPLVVKQEYANVPIPLEEILYVEAMANYTKIFRSSGGYILSHNNLKALREQLPEERFIQVHRSFLIATDKVKSFSKRKITLAGVEKEIPVGRQYAEAVYRALNPARNIREIL